MSQSHNAQRELGYALSSLKYWQKELRHRLRVRKPRAGTIAFAERRVKFAIHRVCFCRGALNAQECGQQWRLAHWSAFVVPTQFAGTGAGQ